MHPIDILLLLILVGLLSWPFLVHAKRKHIYTQYEVVEVQHSHTFKYEARLVHLPTGERERITADTLWGLKAQGRAEARSHYRRMLPAADLPKTFRL